MKSRNKHQKLNYYNVPSSRYKDRAEDKIPSAEPTPAPHVTRTGETKEDKLKRILVQIPEHIFNNNQSLLAELTRRIALENER